MKEAPFDAFTQETDFWSGLVFEKGKALETEHGTSLHADPLDPTVLKEEGKSLTGNVAGMKVHLPLGGIVHSSIVREPYHYQRLGS